MASAAAIEKRLREILPTVDLKTTSERHLREQLAAEFGDVQKHKQLIKSIVDEFLIEAAENSKDEEYQEETDEEESGQSVTSPKGKRKRGASTEVAAAKSTSRPVTGLSQVSFKLSGKKTVRIIYYKGRYYADIREFYEKNGEDLPSVKGIALKRSEWQQLTAALPGLGEALEDEVEHTVQISSDRQAYTSSYKNVWGVHIREMYKSEDDNWLPTKKGILLDKSAFNALVGKASAVTSALLSATDTDPEPKRYPRKRSPPKKEAVKSGSADIIAADKGHLDLGGRRRVTVRNYNNRLGIDLREFYEKDGEALPGKKGIFLSPEEWSKVADAVPKVTEAVGVKNTNFKFKLSDLRQVRVDTYKKNLYVSVREYYLAGDELLPSPRGLNMTPDQWSSLVAGIPTINQMLAAP